MVSAKQVIVMCNGIYVVNVFSAFPLMVAPNHFIWNRAKVLVTKSALFPTPMPFSLRLGFADPQPRTQIGLNVLGLGLKFRVES